MLTAESKSNLVEFRVLAVLSYDCCLYKVSTDSLLLLELRFPLKIDYTFQKSPFVCFQALTSLYLSQAILRYHPHHCTTSFGKNFRTISNCAIFLVCTSNYSTCEQVVNLALLALKEVNWGSQAHLIFLVIFLIVFLVFVFNFFELTLSLYS